MTALVKLATLHETQAISRNFIASRASNRRHFCAPGVTFSWWSRCRTAAVLCVFLL
jgi:hypothetical protein